VPPPTSTATPTATNTPQSSSSTALCLDTPDLAVATDDPIQIIEINKKAEIVTLENVGSSPIDLSDWTLCSLTGAQQHEGFTGVTIEAGETRSLLHLGNSIWLNDAADDGALYDPDGNLISYWADPAS
jgi:micrococcal nuclease